MTGLDELNDCEVTVSEEGEGLPQELEWQVSDGCMLESLLKASPLSLLLSLTVCVCGCVRTCGCATLQRLVIV